MDRWGSWRDDGMKPGSGGGSRGDYVVCHPPTVFEGCQQLCLSCLFLGFLAFLASFLAALDLIC